MRVKTGDKVVCEIVKRKPIIVSKWHYELERSGEIIDKWDTNNLVTNEGLDALLDIMFAAGTQKTAWYIAILDTNHTPDATDTYANSMSTSNYESTEYDEATREAWTPGAVSSQSVDNSGSVAEFTMTGNDTSIYGAALVSDNTKGDIAGSGAIMYSISLFDTAKTGIQDDDVLKVTVTLTTADA